MEKVCTFFQGSTTNKSITEKVETFVNDSKSIFLSVDASHEGIDVYNDLNCYAGFVTVGSYIVVQDTIQYYVKIF